jgi:hypothetical protein
LPPIVTALAVGALPLPDHDKTAVMVTGASSAKSSEAGLTLTLIDVAACVALVESVTGVAAKNTLLPA